MAEPKQKSLEQISKEMKKNNDALSGIDRSFSSFSDEFKSSVQQASNITDGLKDFMSMRQDSLVGFGKELTASFRQTQKWADRIKFDIASFADDNIRDVNNNIDQFEKMQSDAGKAFENRMGALMEGLRDADQGEAIAILNQIHAMREEAHKSLSEEEAARLDFMAKTASRGLDSIASNTGILKGAIMETLPSLDKFAESALGGGILGKVAGSVIRRNRQAKEARAQAAGLAEMGGQTDQVRAASQAAALAPDGMSSSIAAFYSTANETTEILREQNSLFRELLGHTEAQTEAVLDEKEDSAEQRRINERRHDELLAAEGGEAVAGAEGGGGGGLLSGILSGVMAALQGQWISKAATFLMMPLKKVVGMVAGGIGKAVGFIMPKKWTAGLSKFFKTTEKQQMSVMKSTKKSSGFLTKIIDTIKKVFKGIIDVIKTIFKTVMDVITSIAKGIGDVMKELARGIGYFGKKNVLLGAVALVIVAAGIFVFAKAMKEFTKVTWKAVGIAAVSILLLVGSLVALGALMMSGVGAAALLAGAAAMVIVAGAMFILGKAMQEFGKVIPYMMPVFKLLGDIFMKTFGLIFEAIARLIDNIIPILNSLGDLIVKPIKAVGEAISLVISTIAGGISEVVGTITDTFVRLGEPGVGFGLMQTALGIGAITTALGLFLAVQTGGALLGAVGNVAAGVGNWVAGWFGAEAAPTPMEILGALASFPTETLKDAPEAIDNMLAALSRVGELDIDGDKTRETIGLIAALGGAIKAFQNSEPGLLESIGGLIGGAFSAATGWLGSLIGLTPKEKKDPLQILSELVTLAPAISSMGPAMDQLMKGLLGLMALAEGSVDFKNFRNIITFLDEIPDKEIDKKANAIDRLADSIGRLGTNLVQLGDVDIEQASVAMMMAQQQNTQMKSEQSLAEKILGVMTFGATDLIAQSNRQPATMVKTNNINSSANHFHMPIQARNNDPALSDIMRRRR